MFRIEEKAFLVCHVVSADGLKVGRFALRRSMSPSVAARQCEESLTGAPTKIGSGYDLAFEDGSVVFRLDDDSVFTFDGTRMLRVCNRESV